MRKLRVSIPLVCLALLGAASPFARAADPPILEGDWEGDMPVSPAATLKMVFHIAKGPKSGYTATFDSPNQGALGLKVDSVAREKEKVTLTMNTLRGEFTGTFNPEGTAIKGVWTQAGQKFPLVLAHPVEGKETLWIGGLKPPIGEELRIVLRIKTAKDGTLSAVMDSPDQGVSGMKATEVKLDKGMLSFEVKSIAGSYSGRLNEAATEADGKWSQSSVKLPLILKKTDKLPEAKPALRPQMPKGPFPYRSEEVAYANPAARITLAGTLTIPEGKGPFPAVILITGSGPQDRDETLMGHKPFLVLADALSRRGIAVLRVDDRGVGKSTGSMEKATSADFATDVEAGIDFLKKRKEINARKIGLMGHSEGGLIAPIVAAKHPEEVSYIVLLAGTGVPGLDILTAQTELILKAEGAAEALVTQQVTTSKKLYEAVKASSDDSSLKKAITTILEDSVKSLPEAQRKAASDGLPAVVETQMKLVGSPWFRYFMTYDPKSTLAQVHCPVLAINGEKDLQVPAKVNLSAIESALKSGGNSKVTVRELSGLNHLFQKCKTGSPSEYSKIEETFNPEALKVVTNWVVDQTR